MKQLTNRLLAGVAGVIAAILSFMGLGSCHVKRPGNASDNPSNGQEQSIGSKGEHTRADSLNIVRDTTEVGHLEPEPIAPPQVMYGTPYRQYREDAAQE